MIGIALESCRKIVGGSASSGRRPRTRSSRVRRSSIATFRSVPHVNDSRTLLMPSDDVEFTCSRPGHRADGLFDGPRDDLLHLQRADARIPDAHGDRRIAHVGQQVHRQTGQ